MYNFDWFTTKIMVITYLFCFNVTFLKIRCLALAGWLSWLEIVLCTKKVADSIPVQCTQLACRLIPSQDKYEREPIDVSFPFPLSLPLPPPCSLSKINKNISSGGDFFLKKSGVALARVAQWSEHRPANQNVPSSVSSQGMCLGCRPGGQLGMCKRQLIVSLLPYPSL